MSFSKIIKYIMDVLFSGLLLCSCNREVCTPTEYEVINPADNMLIPVESEIPVVLCCNSLSCSTVEYSMTDDILTVRCTGDYVKVLWVY